MSINSLDLRIREATELLVSREQALREKPTDFLGQLSVQSLRAHVEDLQRQLSAEKRDRAIEVVQLRLRGKIAANGTIPLYLLARLSDHFADALHAASQKIKNGKRVSRISQNIVEMLNLRLADVAPGSTRLFITADIVPDLFGRSLLETSLTEVFNLFHADDEGELAGAVSVVGIRSAREIREFLQTVKSEDLEVDVLWNSADNRKHRWIGTYQNIAKLSRSLGQFKIIEPSLIEIKGEVVTLSSRGRFEIFSGGRMFAGTFPSDLLPDVAEIHIGEEVNAILERTVVLNTVTHVEKATFTLQAIRPTGQFRFPVTD